MPTLPPQFRVSFRGGVKGGIPPLKSVSPLGNLENFFFNNKKCNGQCHMWNLKMCV